MTLVCAQITLLTLESQEWLTSKSYRFTKHLWSVLFRFGHGDKEQVRLTVTYTDMHSLITVYVYYRYLAWPGVLFALNSAINQHTLRAKEGSGGALGNLT